MIRNFHLVLTILFSLSLKEATTQSFQKLMEKLSNLQKEFDVLGLFDANRAQKQQLKLIHKSSRIECLLQFDTDPTLELSSKIIKNYIDLSPQCE